MGVFGAVCRRSGDAGFIGPLLGVSSGVVGFNVAMFPRPVRDIVRPARPDVGASAKKFALRAHNGPKLAFDGALGEFFRGPAVVGFRRASLSCRVPGTGALLLAALTLQCAAKPYWWHGGQPAQVATSRVNVRIKGGLRSQDVFTETEVGPDSSQASRRSQYAQGDDGGGTPKGRASRWPEVWRDSWCRTELGGTADTARNRPDLYVRNGNAQMANSGNGQGEWRRRCEKPATRRPPVVCASWGT